MVNQVWRYYSLTPTRSCSTAITRNTTIIITPLPPCSTTQANHYQYYTHLTCCRFSNKQNFLIRENSAGFLLTVTKSVKLGKY